MATAINFSLLSGGEQLAVSRLVVKEQNGKELSASERRFIADMSSRGMGRYRSSSSKYRQSKF